MKLTDEDYMFLAVNEAKAAATRGEIPIGAVLVKDHSGEVLAADGNRTIELKDPSAHAEMLVLREAARVLDNERIGGCTLYVTLEPCAMCAGIISFARVDKLIFAAEDIKGGAVLHGPRFFEQPTCHHRPEVRQGPFSVESGEILRSFFKDRRIGKIASRRPKNSP